jgi:large conductance mechanosensitive channel
MPPIGLLMGNVDFSNLYLDLGGGNFATLAAAEEAGAPIIKYGLFVNSVIDFVIVAFAIFMVIRSLNKLKKKEAEAPPAPAKPSAEAELLAEIRDAIRAGR